jgi:hypothetical protein
MKLLVLISIFLVACGSPTVDLNEAKYEPKIVVEAYIFPGLPIKKVKLSRNFPINSVISEEKSKLINPKVALKNLSTNETVLLVYDELTNLFIDTSEAFIISNDISYEISVEGYIDNKRLTASAITHTPAQQVFFTNKELVTYQYRSNKTPNIHFKSVSNVNYYAIEVQALNPTKESFIYPNEGNIFVEPDDPDNDEKITESKVIEDLLTGEIAYDFTESNISGVNKTNLDLSFSFEWQEFNYEGKYELILLATDKNFRDYKETYNNVEQFGDFVEPVFHFKGDAIGVFGSATIDKMYIQITK